MLLSQMNVKVDGSALFSCLLCDYIHVARPAVYGQAEARAQPVSLVPFSSICPRPDFPCMLRMPGTVLRNRIAEISEGRCPWPQRAQAY